jgi:Fe-Mn family superoxide dismutase
MSTIAINSPSHIGYANGQYVLPPLPYAYDALEPLMDAETVHIHHDKHHASYVAGANAAVSKLERIARGEVDPSEATPTVRNLAFHCSGHQLHTMFWTNMTPTPQPLADGPLSHAINEVFGSTDQFLKVFKATATGVEGSGWALLGIDPLSHRLVVCGVEKHQNLAIPGFIPILACDVWEHAYYLKHKNNRAAYVDSFVALINWADVEARFLASLH